MDDKQKDRSAEAAAEEEASYGYEDWITGFCSDPAYRNWFSHVPSRFLEDNFNLFGFKSLFKHYETCLSVLRNEYDDEEDQKALFSSTNSLDIETEYLYLLIHQRYIQSPEGLCEMRTKFRRHHWGFCPRVSCERCHVLPYGMSSRIGVSGCLVFCPRCRDVYVPKNKNIAQVDGSAFGPNFAAIFMIDAKTMYELPQVKNSPMSVYGFKKADVCRRLDRTAPTIFEEPEGESSDNYGSYYEYDEEENEKESKL